MVLISFCHCKHGSFDIILLHLDTSRQLIGVIRGDNTPKIHQLNRPPCLKKGYKILCNAAKNHQLKHIKNILWKMSSSGVGIRSSGCQFSPY